MDVERQNDGHWHFKLGPVERWAAAAAVGALAAGAGLFANSLFEKLDQLPAIDTRTQVMQQQVQTLTTQLSDIPSLKTDIAEMKVQVGRNSEDIKELRQVRGLR